MTNQMVKTDSFGDDMVWVDSYSGFLPNSDNIPTAPTRNGVSGISHDGEIYCVDCAIDMGLVEIHDGDIMALVDRKLTPTEKAPWTAVVLPSHETMTQMHCGRHDHCQNAVDGENHPYNHDCEIGIGIKEKVLKH